MDGSDDIINSESLENLSKLEKLGEGTYGVVYKVKHKQSGQIYALKKIRTDDTEEGVQATSLREVSALLELGTENHPNIVKLVSLIYDDRKMFLLFEYLDFDLRRYLDQFEKNYRGKLLDRETIRSFTIQILAGLLFAHQRRIMHRDLKPQNILVDSTGTRLKLADFGLARSFGIPLRMYTHEIVTLWYRAPEVLLGGTRYGTEVDIWSVGCIVAELMNLTPLLPGDSEIDQLFRIFRMFGTPTNETWPGVESYRDYKASFPRWTNYRLENNIKSNDAQLLSFLKGMFVLDPSKRFSVLNALYHPYLYDVTTGASPVPANSPLASIVPLPQLSVVRGMPAPA